MSTLEWKSYCNVNNTYPEVYYYPIKNTIEGSMKDNTNSLEFFSNVLGKLIPI